MRCAERWSRGVRRPERAMGRTGARAALRFAGSCALLVVLLLLIAVPQAAADDRWLVQGQADSEFWHTAGESRLLERNDDRPGGQGTFRLWAAGNFAPGLQGFVQGEAYGGSARPQANQDETGVSTALEQAFLRWTSGGRNRLLVEGGRIVTPIGDFARRYLPQSNPLVGAPSDYSVRYPEGVRVAGWMGRWDAMVAVVDRPLGADWYSPEAGRSFRPMIGAGVTPTTGLRLGAFATRGAYLGPSVVASLDPGTSWSAYDQSLYGFEMQFSRGHFELHGEFARSSYEVPSIVEKARGKAYFVEPRYAFTPRLYGALRLEENEYPYIMPIYGTTWIASDATVGDAEAGVGYRISRDLLVKVSYRRDRWVAAPAVRPFVPPGSALAAQVTYRFDVKDFVPPAR